MDQTKHSGWEVCCQTWKSNRDGGQESKTKEDFFLAMSQHISEITLGRFFCFWPGIWFIHPVGKALYIILISSCKNKESTENRNPVYRRDLLSFKCRCSVTLKHRYHWSQPFIASSISRTASWLCDHTFAAAKTSFQFLVKFRVPKGKRYRIFNEHKSFRVFIAFCNSPGIEKAG